MPKQIFAKIEKPKINLENVIPQKDKRTRWWGKFSYRNGRKSIPMKKIKKIGQGSFGSVKLITFKDGTQVIIKQVNGGDTEIEDLNYLNQLAKKNEYVPCGLVNGTVIHEDSEIGYIAMQVMDGDLDHLIAKKKFKPLDIFRIINHLLDSLLCLLKLNLVYTDLKWENVLYKKVGSRYTIGLGDFGSVSKIGDDNWSRTYKYPNEGDLLEEIDGVWGLWGTLAIGLLRVYGKSKKIIAHFKSELQQPCDFSIDFMKETISKHIPSTYKDMILNLMEQILSKNISSFESFQTYIHKNVFKDTKIIPTKSLNKKITLNTLKSTINKLKNNKKKKYIFYKTYSSSINLYLTKTNLLKVLDHDHLSNFVVDVYIKEFLIPLQGNNWHIFLSESFNKNFVNKIWEEEDDEKIKRMIKRKKKKLNLSRKRDVMYIVPYFESNHWRFFKVNILARTISQYDSLSKHFSNTREDKMIKIAKIFDFMFPDEAKTWNGLEENVPQQYADGEGNFDDCGVFMLRFIEFLLTNRNINNVFLKDMHKIRKRIVHQLLQII